MKVKYVNKNAVLYQKLRLGTIPVLVSLLLALGLLAATPAFAQGEALRGLDSYVGKAMKDWQVPGLAVAIVKDDALIFARGYGFRKIGSREKVDKHTLFAIASNTKAFTASLLGMLIDEGKLSWDDKVVDHIPHFQLYDPYVTREIRVRDLLTHRSGLPTFGGDHLWIGNPLSQGEIISRLRFLKPSASFRTKFQYQNLMFLVAGEIISTITGKSWQKNVKERIFNPLAMAESVTSVKELIKRENVAVPHEIVSGKLSAIDYDEVDNIAAAGGINSNVVDMAQWMRMNLNKGKNGDREILSPTVIREMQTLQFPRPISSFNEKELGMRFSGYGLGWGISDYKGYKMINHGGALSGMISLQALLPEKGLGVIVLTNFAPNSLTQVLTYWILDRFLEEPEKDWNAVMLERREKAEKKREKAEMELQMERVKGTSPSLELEEYTGKYFDNLSGEAQVRLENGKLVFDYNPRHLGDLEHWHYDTFRVTWRNPIFDMPAKSFLTFYLDEKGKVDCLNVTFYDPIVFEKIE